MSTLNETIAGMQTKIDRMILLNQQKDLELERLLSMLDCLELSIDVQDKALAMTKGSPAMKSTLSERKVWPDHLKHKVTQIKMTNTKILPDDATARSSKEHKVRDIPAQHRESTFSQESVTHLQNQVKKLEDIIEVTRMDAIDNSFQAEHLKGEAESLKQEIRRLIERRKLLMNEVHVKERRHQSNRWRLNDQTRKR
jgi:hypothetical protein